jgi:hypothetical protein
MSVDLGGQGGNGYGLGTGFEEDGGKGNVRQIVVRSLREALERISRGVGDALRLDRSWNLVWG